MACAMDEEMESDNASDDEPSKKMVCGASKASFKQKNNSTRMVQSALLVWLDQNSNKYRNDDTKNTMAELRGVVNTVKLFTDDNRCIEFIKKINKDKICMIVSGTYGEKIVPTIHDMPQINSIFVFCNNKDYHEVWSNKYKKVHGVFIRIKPICDALKLAIRNCEQNAVPISLLAADNADNNNTVHKKLDKLECSFMYTLILKEVLLKINFEEKHFKNFIKNCREQFIENKIELDNINNFEKDYRKKTPTWWYTCESFIFKKLNRALRLMEVDEIIDMGFFINDLHRQIMDLNNQQYHRTIHHSETLTLYRGQGVSKPEFEQMKKAQGGFLSFNSFLSTSTKRQSGFEFAEKNLRNQDLISILFVMTINPMKSRTAFADISEFSQVPNEDEVLFSMHTVFRIGEIKPVDNAPRVFQVNLTLTGDNDEDFRALSARLREELKPIKEGWPRLGFLLMKMGQYNQAEQVFQILLRQTNNNREKTFFYIELGGVKHRQGKYDEAIQYFKSALKTYDQSCDIRLETLAAIHNNLGCSYREQRKYADALSSFNEALTLQEQNLFPNDPAIACTLHNSGNVFGSIGKYQEAYIAYKKALKIRQISLPATHPDLASTYHSLGNILYKSNQLHDAQKCYEKAVSIATSSLPPNHPDLQLYKNSLQHVSTIS